MSHYDLPRLHFRGGFRANVATANNDDLAIAFPDQQFVDTDQVTVNRMGMDDAAFQAWLRDTAPPFGIRGGWNVYGDCYCDFPDTTVRSTHPTNSGLVVDPAIDSFIGAEIDLPAKLVMVDLNPEGTLSTQLFCDEFNFTANPSMRIGGRPSRFYSHNIARRNLAASGFTAFAASWYAAIEPDEMSISAGNSPVLMSFQSAHESGAGLFIAFCTYFLSPLISQNQLAQDFAAGLTTQNPAIGHVVGTVGLWKEDELKAVPMRRRLVPGALLQHDHVDFRLNSAQAHTNTDTSTITLDLMNAFPEIDDSLEKVNVGRVRLAVDVAGDKTAERHDIGEINYDREQYERESGLFDIAYSADLSDKIEQGDLVLYQPDTDAVLLRESRLVIATDNRCLYLHEGETTQVKIRVRDKGDVPSAVTTVQLRQYRTTNRVFAASPPADEVVSLPASVSTDPGGEGVFSVAGQNAGTCLIAFVAPGQPDQSIEFYCSIRVLPTDSYDHLSNSELSFQLIYDEVLRYYHLLYPSMSERFDLSSEISVELHAQAILDRISPAIWDRSAYMPVTRELSAGKRRLLERWCRLILGLPTNPPIA